MRRMRAVPAGSGSLGRTAALAAGAVLAAACALAAITCRGGETGPVAGELSLRLSAPGTGDRAILVEVVGAQTAVSRAPGASYSLYSRTLAGDTVRIAVVAPAGSGIAPGELLRIAVPDTRRAGSYTGTVLEVAGPDYATRSATGYSVTVGQ